MKRNIFLLIFASIVSFQSLLAQTNNFPISPKKGTTFRLSDKIYSTDSLESIIIIKDIKTFLASNPNMTIEISCHTDSRGSEEKNKQFTDNWSQYLTEQLTKLGVLNSQFNVIGMGETKPVTAHYYNCSYNLNQNANIDCSIEIDLTQDHIDRFRLTNRDRFEKLHFFNKRVEITILDIKN